MGTEAIIDDEGRPRFGQFDGPVGRMNWKDFAQRSPMGRPVTPIRKFLSFNQFQYYGIISDDLIVGVGMANVRYMGIGFVYLFQPSTGRLVQRSVQAPLARGVSLSDQPQAGINRLDFGGIQAEIEAVGTDKLLRVHGGVDIEINAAFSEAGFEHMALCTQAGPTGWVYAQKVAGVRCTGSVRSPLGEFDLSEIDAFAHHDYSAGAMRHETYWRWACLSGNVSGTRVGLNLSCGVNETSFSENCFWLDGTLHSVGLAHFDFTPRSDADDWHVTTNDGRVDLMFTPLGNHKERIWGGYLASNFTQHFGVFEGTLATAAGTHISVDGLHGFCEDHYAKW